MESHHGEAEELGIAMKEELSLILQPKETGLKELSNFYNTINLIR